ncbi:MAG: DUF3303 domain-containing protein, partial [Pseudomonadota bacterium]|nr:DUF3303 domain-containing protein [Pseudomonadota bacterium]
TFTMKPEVKGRDEAIAQFKKTDGQPPKGAKLLGRWTAAYFSGGYDLLESDDACSPRSTNDRVPIAPDAMTDLNVGNPPAS